MLNALENFPCTASIVKVPRLYLFNRETNTQVIEDIAGFVDLKTVFMSPTANDVLSQCLATFIGRALGLGFAPTTHGPQRPRRLI